MNQCGISLCAFTVDTVEDTTPVSFFSKVQKSNFNREMRAILIKSKAESSIKHENEYI